MNEYLLEQYKSLHEQDTGYGPSNSAMRDKMGIIILLSEQNCKTVLDFGCGKGRLVNTLQQSGFDCTGYDPAVPKFLDFPKEDIDAVICTDVMEHLDDSYEDELRLMLSINPKCIYFNIACGRAKMLPDGKTPRHSLVRSPTWWVETLCKFFSDYELQQSKVTSYAEKSVILKFIKK